MKGLRELGIGAFWGEGGGNGRVKMSVGAVEVWVLLGRMCPLEFLLERVFLSTEEFHGDRLL